MNDYLCVEFKASEMKQLLILLILVACSQKQAETLLAPQAFDKKFKSTEGAILLDVRTEEEVSEGTLPGAINIVYDKDFANKLGSLERKPVFVYCAGGVRSAKAAGILRNKGFEVYDLEGGYNAWKKAGMPVK